MENQSKMMGKKPFEYYIFKLEKDSIIPAENGTKKNQRFRCDICSAIFKRGFSLKRHYLRFHINVIYINERDLANCGITPTETTETGLYKCHDCSTHFDVKDELMEHRNSYHVNGRKPGGLNYFCDRCSMTFTNKHNFLSHVKRACQKEDVKVCPHCQKEYARKGRLEKHMQHCKSDCKKIKNADPEVQVLKIAKPSISLSLTQTSDDIDDDSKSIDSGDESDNNSRCSLTNDFNQTYPDFKGEQDGIEDFLDSQFDFSQSVERYVRDVDDKVYLVLDTAKVVYPLSERPYDDPSYYEIDYPFNLDDLPEEERPQDDSVNEPVLTWQELKFSADSDGQDVFLRLRATYLGSSAKDALQPTIKTYSSKAKPGPIESSKTVFLDGQCDTSLPSSNSEDGSVNKERGCVEAVKPKINLDKLFNLIDTSAFEFVEAPTEQFDLLNYTQDVSTNQSVDSLSNWSQCNRKAELKNSRSFEEEEQDPPSKRPKVEEEGRKNLFRSKHTCPECGKSFGKPGKMVSHRRLAHGSQGVKTTLDSFCKFRYLPLWSPRRDESAEPPPERLDPFSLEFVNARCEENVTVHMDGKFGDPECLSDSAHPVSNRLSWKRHAYLQTMTFDQRNQFLSDIVKFPLAEQFSVHSKLPCEVRDTSSPLDVLSSVGLCRFEQIVPDTEPQVFEGVWSMPKCFICRACGMRSKELSTYLSHQTCSHPLIFCSHILLDVKSAEVPRELWSSWALGHRLLRASSRKKGRRRVRSLAALAEIVSVDLIEAPSATTLRRLRSSSALVKPKRGKAETPKSCTKCNKRDMTQVELHGHIVECGKKLARLSSRERLGSSKSKKHHSIKGRHGMKRKIPSGEDISKKKSKKRKNERFKDNSDVADSVPSRRVTRSSEVATRSLVSTSVQIVKQEEAKQPARTEKNTQELEIKSDYVSGVGTTKGETILVIRKKAKSRDKLKKRKNKKKSKKKTKVKLEFSEISVEELHTPARNTRSSNRLINSVIKEEVEDKVDSTSVKRNILPELLAETSAFARVPMDPSKSKSCPKCSKQFRYMVALRKHFEKCFTADVKTETVEVTVSRGLSTDFKTIADEDSDYIDLDTALELADAREDTVLPTKFEVSSEIIDIPDSRLAVTPASRSLRDMSYEDRVALARKLEEILECSRQDFDIQMLSVLSSVKERALYLSLSCPICLRKYKYRLKFKRHLIEGLLYGCQKRKGEEEVISSDEEGGIEPAFLCHLYESSGKSDDPETRLAAFATLLADALYKVLQTDRASPASQWVISRIGTLATVDEIETLLKKCNACDLVPLCSTQHIQPLVTSLITEKLSPDKKRKYLLEQERPRSAPILRSYLRKQSTSTADGSTTADHNVPSTSALDRERVLNQEVSAIILQQKYLNEPPLHPPELHSELQRPASESMLNPNQVLTDEFILSQLAPLAADRLGDTSGDSGYATCNNSNDQFQMLQQFLDDPNDLNSMPTLSPENFPNSCTGPIGEVLQFSADSPPVLESYQTALDSVENFLFPIECLTPGQVGTASSLMQN